MSIRCSELNLPALIGVGEVNFSNILKHKIISIDCVTGKISFFKLNIAIIPTVRQIRKDQFELSVDNRIFNFLIKFLKEIALIKF